MSEQPEILTIKVAELEKKLNASLDVISKLVKALDYMRNDDARFIFRPLQKSVMLYKSVG